MDSLEVLHKMSIDSARELKLQDKVIYLMADFIEKDDLITEEFICPYCKYQLNKECTEKECIEQIIKYFTNKVEESEK